MGGDGFTTPSEWWNSRLRRFVGLGPVDGLRLSRTIWIFALVVYGFQLATAVATLVATLSGRWDGTIAFTISVFVLPTLLRTLEPALWLLIVRLLIETCNVLLQDRLNESVSSER
jgi:hypothetical protein